MNPLLDKLIIVEGRISQQKRGFVLFALLSRDKEKGLWDLVLSAEWFGSDQKTTLDYIIGELQKELKPEDLTKISRIVILNPTDQIVRNINMLIHTEHSKAELIDVRINDLWLDHAFIITSKRPESLNRRQKSNSLDKLKAVD